MRHFNSLAMIAVAMLALSACSSNDETGYLGSRDDIIVNNTGMPATKVASKDVAKTEVKKAKEQTAKEATNEAIDQLEKAMGVEAKADVDAVTEAKMKPMVPKSPHESPAVQPMKTTTMKAPAPAKAPSSVTTPPPPVSNSGDIPADAKPGECYAKVLIPGVTESRTERVQISEEQEVLARIVPPKYRIETERVLVKEARQYWKQGRGPVEKVNQTTGEILCLVEEPAEYKTVEKKILVSPEQPEYKTIPAQFENVTKTDVIQTERLEWRRILCDTNVTTATIMRVQRALQAKGYDIGSIDGRVGSKTMKAINAYQLKNGLASRGITYETLGHLGVSLEGA